MYSDTGDLSRADRPTASFLAAYRESAGGDEHLTNLRFHWARYVLHSLNSQLKKSDEPTETAWEGSEFELLRSEFQSIVEGRAMES